MGLKREPWAHVCTRCGATYMSAGYNALYCPTCRKAAHYDSVKRYVSSGKGRDIFLQAKRDWYHRHKGEMQTTEERRNWYREKSRRYYAEHRDEILAKHRETYKQKYMADPNYFRVKNAKWRAEHPERASEIVKAYKSRHSEEIKAYFRKRYAMKRLRREAARNKPGAALQLARMEGRIVECPRMHVTMLHLPCGMRDECWCGRPCQHVPEGKEPPRQNFNPAMNFA